MRAVQVMIALLDEIGGSARNRGGERMSANESTAPHIAVSDDGASLLPREALIDLLEEDYSVILLDADFPEGMALRSSLQAMGVQVHIGPHSIEGDGLPVIMLCASSRQRSDIKGRLKLAQVHFPEAAIAFVTGKASTSSFGSIYEDARRLLCAAGIGFASPSSAFL
jgi:hypothetical protein